MKKFLLFIAIISIVSCTKDDNKPAPTFEKTYNIVDIDVLGKWESYNHDLKVVQQGETITANFYNSNDTIIFKAQQSAEGSGNIISKDDAPITGTITYNQDSCIVQYNWAASPTGYVKMRGK